MWAILSTILCYSIIVLIRYCTWNSNREEVILYLPIRFKKGVLQKPDDVAEFSLPPFRFTLFLHNICRSILVVSSIFCHRFWLSRLPIGWHLEKQQILAFHCSYLSNELLFIRNLSSYWIRKHLQVVVWSTPSQEDAYVCIWGSNLSSFTIAAQTVCPTLFYLWSRALAFPRQRRANCYKIRKSRRRDKRPRVTSLDQVQTKPDLRSAKWPGSILQAVRQHFVSCRRSNIVSIRGIDGRKQKLVKRLCILIE